MKITVTGAAGHLGSVATRRLHACGHEVRATDVTYRTGLPVPLEIVNLLDPLTAYRLIEGADAVVHIANHPYFPGREAQRIHNENVVMNYNVFEAARQVGCKKIVWISSVQAFAGHRPGDEDIQSQLAYLPIDGEMPVNPGNPYALSKVAGEAALRYFARRWGMSCVAVRFPVLVGDDHARWLRKNRTPDRHWNLDEAFTYLKIEEAATLLEAIVRAELPGYRCYFAAAPDPGVSAPVRDLVTKYFPNVPLRKPLAELEGFVDTSRITAETGWTATSLFADLHESATTPA